MLKKTLCILFILIQCLTGSSQSNTLPETKSDTLSNEGAPAIATHRVEPDTSPVMKKVVYSLKPSVDIPIIVAGTAFSLYAFTYIYDKPASTEEEVIGLKTSDINSFDSCDLGIGKPIP